MHSIFTCDSEDVHIEKQGEHFNNLHKARKVKHKPTSSLLEDEDEDEEEDDEVSGLHPSFFSLFFFLSFLLLQSEFFPSVPDVLPCDFLSSLPPFLLS